MEDFKNSVAQLDVEVSTDISYEAVVGENFYKFLYISQKTGLTPTLLTKDTYVDVLKNLIADDANRALATNNIASLFDYGTSIRGIILSAQDYEKYKYKGYFVYLESEFVPHVVDHYNPVAPDPSDDPKELGWYELSAPDTYVLTEDETVDDQKTYYERTQTADGIELSEPCKAVFDYMNTVIDKVYSQPITDIAVPYTATTKDQNVADLLKELNKYSLKLSNFARGANTDYSWDKDGDGNVKVGYSPALYQLGRTLGFINSTGTPVGNSCDSVACAQADVLVTRSTDPEELENPSALLIDWMQNVNLQYFKTVGNNTGNMSCYGGWTIKNSVVCADWIVNYSNHMTKIACAEITTGMNTFKDEQSYDKCVNAMDSIVSSFVTIGRISEYVISAPPFGSVKSNGHTIVIPDAWRGVYVDNLRKVKIQGSLTVEA